jgi:hypothetical protein
MKSDADFLEEPQYSAKLDGRFAALDLANKYGA